MRCKICGIHDALEGYKTCGDSYCQEGHYLRGKLLHAKSKTLRRKIEQRLAELDAISLMGMGRDL